MRPISGHVYRFEGARGPVWRAKYRLPDGRQIHRTIGPAWTERGRPRAGWYTKRTAEAWLREILDQARAGTLPGMVRTGVTFADACAEWLRYMEHDLDRKPSTLVEYRSSVRAHLVPAFGPLRLEDVTTEHVEAWKSTLRVSNRTKVKLLTVMNGVFVRARRAYRLGHNPIADVEKPRQRRSLAIEVFSPEEVMALVRAAGSEQDAAIFLTAAFTGLRRGELIALHWRDVDFAGQALRVRASFAGGQLTTPKSGKVRSVPMAPDVATALARLAERDDWTGDDHLVFPGVGGYFLDGRALSRRYAAATERAGLRPLRFHDLRHTFASHLIIDLGLDPAQVSRILGHARITITLDIYTHLFEDARHAQDIRTRMAASPFAGLLEPTTPAPGATVLKLR